jgi:hypothetical protein
VRTGAGDQANLVSDDSGRFEGWMRTPSRDWLEVEVEAEEHNFRRRVEFTDLKLPRERLWLDIRLEDLHIAGQVVDPQGEPVAGARVRAYFDPREEADTLSRRDGRFEVEGLSRRPYVVFAESDQAGSSDAIVLDLSAGSISGTRLVLQPRRRLTGVLLAAHGQPVAGAELRFIPAGRPSGPIAATTDLSGRFAVQVPASDRVVATVLAPSQLLWSGCLGLAAGGAPTTITLPPPPGGTLVVRVEGDDTLPPARGGEVVVLTGDGGFFRFRDQLAWLLATTGRAFPEKLTAAEDVTRTSAVAPGLYALAWSDVPDWLLAAQRCGGGGEAVDWKPLENGAEVVLSFDVTPQQKATAATLTARD